MCDVILPGWKSTLQLGMLAQLSNTSNVIFTSVHNTKTHKIHAILQSCDSFNFAKSDIQMLKFLVFPAVIELAISLGFRLNIERARALHGWITFFDVFLIYPV